MEKIVLFATFVWVVEAIGVFALRKGINQVSDKIDESKKEEQLFNAILIRHMKVLSEGYYVILETLESGKTDGNLKRQKKNVEEVSRELDEWIIKKASRD